MTKLFFPALTKDILEIKKDWTITLCPSDFEQNKRFYLKNIDGARIWNYPDFKVTFPSGIHLVAHRYRIYPELATSNIIFKIVYIPDDIAFYWNMKYHRKIRAYQKICVSIPDANTLEYNLVVSKKRK
jgi:hypothetical protein